jgi:hypothetical protein
MEAILLVAEHDGSTMFARIGMMRGDQCRQAEARESAKTQARQAL